MRDLDQGRGEIEIVLDRDELVYPVAALAQGKQAELVG